MRIVTVIDKIITDTVIETEAVVCSYPQAMLVIFIQRTDIIMRADYMDQPDRFDILRCGDHRTD